MERYVCSDAKESFAELVTQLQSAVAHVTQGLTKPEIDAMMAALHSAGFSVQVRSFRGPEPEFPAPMAIITGQPVPYWPPFLSQCFASRHGPKHWLLLHIQRQHPQPPRNPYRNAAAAGRVSRLPLSR